jgi:hypothetical protein
MRAIIGNDDFLSRACLMSQPIQYIHQRSGTVVCRNNDGNAHEGTAFNRSGLRRICLTASAT